MKLFRSIAGRLGGFLVLIALIPVLVTAIFSSTLYTKTIQEERTEALAAVADATRDRIEDFILTRITDVNALSTLAMWVNLLRNEDEGVIQISSEARRNLIAYISEKEYYDLLLIDNEGNIRFTVVQESDLGQNIHAGELQGTQLVQVVDASVTLMQTEISNFAYYAPSNDFAAFIASPVFDDGEILGTVVLQVDQRVLNRIIIRYQGIGETGDILTATKSEGGLVITVPSRFNQGLFLQEVSENVFKPLARALSGEQGGGVFVNHTGEEVLAEWRYLPSLNWGLIIMVNTEELYAATAYFYGILTWILLFAVALAIGGTILTYSGVSGPLVQFTSDVRRLRKDRLPESVPVRGRYEIAELGRSFNTLLASVRDYQSTLETEVNNRTRDLKTALQDAEKASRAKGVFLATMSHEIRTPLNGVIGFTELLKDTPLNEKQRMYVESAQVSGKSLLRIINDILDLSKIEAGGLKLDLVVTDLRVLFRESVQIIAKQAYDKGLHVVLEMESGFCWQAEVDETRLKQVLINLLSNAVKFTDKGEIHLQASSRSVSDEVCEYTVKVVDTGIGIPADKMEHLFSAFSQADSSTSRKYGGTGLGLVISRLLVEKMDGDITLQSTPGQGTTFTITFEARSNAAKLIDEPVYLEITRELLVGGNIALPVNTKSTSVDFDGMDEVVEKPKPEEPTFFDTLRILVAEDTPLNMTLIKAVLKSRLADVHILEAHNGVEAVNIASTQALDLILMDVNMPEMDGLEATKSIRSYEKAASKKPVPIVALTAGVLVEDRNLAFESGMDDFLSKPLNVDELKSTLTRLIGAEILRFKE